MTGILARSGGRLRKERQLLFEHMTWWAGRGLPEQTRFGTDAGDMARWCSENLSKKSWCRDGLRFWFRHEKDRILFRLVWSEQLLPHRHTDLSTARRRVVEDVVVVVPAILAMLGAMLVVLSLFVALGLFAFMIWLIFFR